MPWENRFIYTVSLLCAALVRFARGAEEDSDDFKLSFWDRSVNLRGAFGYKDNVLLSAAQPQGSAFWLSGVDFSLLRAGLDGGPSVTLFATGEDRRYFSSSEVDHEQLLLTQAKAMQEVSPVWKVGGVAQYLYADQVFDASATEQLIETLPVKSHNIELAPIVTRVLPADMELEFRFFGQRQLFSAPLDNYWEFGPEITWSKKYGNRSTIALSYRYDHRLYDTRNPLDLARQPIDDRLLDFDQNEFEFTLNHVWDKERNWRSRMRLLFEKNDDNGVGFYDYYRYRMIQKFGYYGKDWQATVEGKILHYDYQRQPVIDGTDIRQLWEYAVAAHVEKIVWKKVKVFVDEEFETLNSNYRLERYQVNTVSAGVDWEF